MRIGIDAHVLGKGKGGAERYVQQLVEQVPLLLPEYEFFALVNKRYIHEASLPANLRLVRLPFSDPLIQRSIVLPLLAWKLRLDLLHVQRIAPPAVRCPVVLTVHDLLPLTHPSDHLDLRSAMVRWLTPGSVRRACAILTVSETMREEIERYFPSAAGRVFAVYNGAQHDFFHPLSPSDSTFFPIHERLDVRSGYLLYLGAVMERKNLSVLLEGFARFVRERETKPTLVIGGMCRSPKLLAELQKLARVSGIDGLVRFAGYLTEKEYLQLLQRAALFVAPSRGEGFDLPPLEAMACGIPVIASDIPVHRELFAGRCRFFSTADPAGLARELARLWDDETMRTRLRNLGRERSLEFTWKRMTLQIATLYREILETNGARRAVGRAAEDQRIAASEARQRP